MRLLKPKEYSQGKRIFGQAFATAGAAAMRARKRSRGYSRTNTGRRTGMRSKKRIGLGRTLTTRQKDFSRTYVRKPMPYRKKRKWVQFKNKVNTVAEDELGTQTVIFNNQDTAGITEGVAGGQGTLEASLYGVAGRPDRHNDLAIVRGMLNDGDPTAAAGINVDDTTKYIFHSGVLDITLRNTSKQRETANDPYIPWNECSLEVDLYIISSNKKWQPDTLSIRQCLDSGFATTKGLDGAGNQLTRSKRGVTVFDCPDGISKYGLQVQKKTKYFIPYGQQVTYQMRDPKRHVMRRGNMSTGNYGNTPNKPGLTHYVFISYKPVTGLPNLADINNIPQLSMGNTRKYMFKVEGMNDTRDEYKSGSIVDFN
ncbi:putative capsid protein [Avon-Heathcote Estuary associated circular virus 13]|uniref:putative capsid protein n=1 Tax=Avon-Heathcote Estuary associated circular virus 13 TaxID=1618236 RepID=UPI0005CDBFDF|nr:putative capsid protein [Avon-Heathcote Estuary associated circular virus 13]AJP36409.1 putative capsid protein [Avon-Heathcote Estuary associated circular virus 13]AJP36412.1 putative capsid protein [Avon-Heathcote Estuary associated circular virus 13]AJP36413.1 putative capsid protein [Avon-Heathcote Estuary associated circular virus 13]